MSDSSDWPTSAARPEGEADGRNRARRGPQAAAARRRQVSKPDPDGGFTKRGQRGFVGCKAHLAVDQASDLIRGAILTGADVSDSLADDALICGDEAAVYTTRPMMPARAGTRSLEPDHGPADAPAPAGAAQSHLPVARERRCLYGKSKMVYRNWSMR
jgi:hypothetical protein